MKYCLTLMMGTWLIFCLFSSSINATPMLTIHHTVTLTEYYDYECPHCRRMASVINDLQSQVPNLTIVLHVTPLLNATSPEVARLALAATAMQHPELHTVLLKLSHAPTVTQTLQLAKHFGINTTRLISMASSDNLTKQLRKNITMASHYAIKGIIHLPALILKNQHGEIFIRYGEQSPILLLAIVKQLEADNVKPKIKTTKAIN